MILITLASPDASYPAEACLAVKPGVGSGQLSRPQEAEQLFSDLFCVEVRQPVRRARKVHQLSHFSRA